MFFADVSLASTLMHVSDELVLLTANRILKMKEKNIRLFGAA